MEIIIFTICAMTIAAIGIVAVGAMELVGSRDGAGSFKELARRDLVADCTMIPKQELQAAVSDVLSSPDAADGDAETLQEGPGPRSPAPPRNAPSSMNVFARLASGSDGDARVRCVESGVTVVFEPEGSLAGREKIDFVVDREPIHDGEGCDPDMVESMVSGLGNMIFGWGIEDVATGETGFSEVQISEPEIDRRLLAG